MQSRSQLIISNGLHWVYHQERVVHLFSLGNWLVSHKIPEKYSLSKALRIKDEGNIATIYYPKNEKRILSLEKNAFIESKPTDMEYILEPVFSNSLTFRGDLESPTPQEPIEQLAKNKFTRKGFPIVEMMQTATTIVITTTFNYLPKKISPPSYNLWRQSQPELECPKKHFNTLFQNALKSLYKLRLLTQDGEIRAAGFPDFPSLFGRDFALSALAEIYLAPAKVKEELLVHIKHIGKKYDLIRNEQSGRAVHEYNYDAITLQGLYKHFPSYYANDSNALLLVTIFRLAKIQKECIIIENCPTIIKQLYEHMLSLDLDGDGFLEYQQQQGQLLKHQTWRDGGDEIRSPEDKPVKQPIAPLHDQLCFLAAQKELLAYQEQYKHSPINLPTRELRRILDKGKKALNEQYWMPELESYALALDGENRQLKVVNSDVCLGYYFELFDKKKAEQQYKALIDENRLLAKEGLRTVSKEHPLYSPKKYQRGAVWPWQLAVLIPGLRNYNLNTEAFLRCLDYLATGDSIAEVYIPDSIVLTPLSSCIEQRWSAAMPWLALLEGFCGVKVNYDLVELKPMEGLSDFYPLIIRGLFFHSKKHDLLLETPESAKITD